jgi:sporulation protein YqfC
MRLISKLDRYLENKNYEIILKDSSVNIINFSEIIDFSMNKISVRCDNKIINVEGKNLIISKMLDDELLVTGNISNLRIN